MEKLMQLSQRIKVYSVTKMCRAFPARPAKPSRRRCLRGLLERSNLPADYRASSTTIQSPVRPNLAKLGMVAQAA